MTLFTKDNSMKLKTKEESIMKWSLAQQDIFSACENTLENIVVIATAGSGKTTTIVEAARRLAGSGVISRSLLDINAATQKRVLVMSFNKHIAEELATRLPSHVQSSTMHSYGFSELKRAFPGISVDTNKTDKIVKSLLGDPWKERDFKEKKRKLTLHASTLAMISICKANTFGIESSMSVSIVDICNMYNVEIADGSLVAIAEQALKLCDAYKKTVDFDDMLWLPVIQGIKLSHIDIVFVDEAQDLNQTQIELLKQMHTRIIAVGDPWQSLYSFRGAAPDSMQQLETQLHCKRMPLSTSYRCPQRIVELAQTINSDIQAAPDAPLGSVLRVSEDDLLPVENDMIICRYNAPLVMVCLKLLQKRIKATIRGRDIGKEIAKFAKKFCDDVSSISVLRQKLTEHYQTEQAKQHTRAWLEQLSDKINVVFALAENLSVEIRNIPAEIEALFSDEKSPIVLSTIHRAKGLEADNVWILERKSTREHTHKWELQQERNALFVAYTRAKKTLTIVEERE